MLSVYALLSTVVATTPPAARLTERASAAGAIVENVTATLSGAICPRISPRGLAAEVAIT